MLWEIDSEKNMQMFTLFTVDAFVRPPYLGRTLMLLPQ